METSNLDKAFNPSDFGVLYSHTRAEEDLLDEDKKKKENELYMEVLNGLKADTTKLGMDASYSSEILIREVAMNILLMNRIKLQLICRSLLRDRKLLRRDYVTDKKDRYEGKSHKSISYENYFGEEEIHPLFDKLIPQLQKQINDGLRQLGLLPQQQVERQKVVLVEKLKQRLIQINTTNASYTADVTLETKK